MIFDTHAHYDDEAFDEDRDQLLSSMKDGGVGCIVNVCASAGGFDGTLKLMEAYPFCLRSCGRSPGRCGNYDPGHPGRDPQTFPYGEKWLPSGKSAWTITGTKKNPNISASRKCFVPRWTLQEKKNFPS